MSENSKIEWTDHTWSPWYGCTKVSPGRANCYAETLNNRFHGGENWGNGKPRRKAKDWNKPRRWSRRRALGYGYGLRELVFPSQCDWLDPEVPVELLAEFLKLIHDTPNLCWQLLTKRPELFMQRWRDVFRFVANDRVEPHFLNWLAAWVGTQHCSVPGEPPEPPRNVWVGASVEDQQRADERIPPLLQIPAVLRFLSVEPLLAPVDLLTPAFNGADSFGRMAGIDWVIIGGESGDGARPCNVNWVRDIRDQCKAAGVPVFVKQLGKVPVIDRPDGSGHVETFPCELIKHPKGGDPTEWPKDLRVREMPCGVMEDGE